MGDKQIVIIGDVSDVRCRLFVVQPTYHARRAKCARPGYGALMELSAAHAEALQQKLESHLRFLNALCERLKLRGVLPGDPIFQAAHRARDAMQDLYVACHYRRCPSGVGR